MRMLTAVAFALLCASPMGVARGQSVRFPDSPQGRLAAGFLAALNSPDEGALGRFQEANFSEAALTRRPAQERLERNRQTRESVGTLTITAVKSATATRLVATGTGSHAPGVTLTITITFTSGPNPKIDTLQITG